ncbi:MAG: alpha/beta hydrolase [Deltaproteobacteria bacterium]|nr:alpha/beta hydrolase [Deltaproteobacteria bacterium]
MPAPDLIGRAQSSDGTGIAYQVYGTSGPFVVFGNGIGVTHASLALQLNELRRSFRVVCWDHRGIAGSKGVSERPPSTNRDTSRDADKDRQTVTPVASHAGDCLAVMDALAIERAHYVGWSMGAQVGFEVLRLAPERISRLVALSGVAGRIFQGALPFAGLERALGWMIEGAMPLVPRFSPLARRLIATRASFALAKGIGFVGTMASPESFMGMLRGVAELDHVAYLQTLIGLGEHDAMDVLKKTDVPLLFVGGRRDRLTPVALLESLARQAANARVHIVEGGTHFALIEAPDEVNAVIEDFLLRP